MVFQLLSEFLWVNRGLEAVVHCNNAITQEDAGETRKSLKYLMTLATLRILNGSFDVLVGSWLPFYSVFKLITLYQLLSPKSRATELIFDYVLEPFVLPLLTDVQREISNVF